MRGARFNAHQVNLVLLQELAEAGFELAPVIAHNFLDEVAYAKFLDPFLEASFRLDVNSQMCERAVPLQKF